MGNNMRYSRSPMMPRMAAGCNTYTTSRMGNRRDSCGNVSIHNTCDSCNSSPMSNTCDSCSSSPMNPNYDGCETCQNNRNTNSCNDCSKTKDTLKGMPLAMAYVPWQNFSCTYEAMQGLHAGTIFPELEKPFYGKRRMH